MRKQANVDFYIKISTGNNLYNLDTTKFKGYVLSEIDGTITPLTNTFSEIVNTVVSVNSALVNGIEGVKTFEVANGSIFNDGEVIQIDSYYYYIENIIGNTITTNVQVNLHIAGATVSTVGNTGIYKVKSNISTAGDYTAFIANAEINMQNTPCPITIVDASNADISEQISIIQDEITRSSFI